jgi:RNA polymerase sigma-70 factor (ECF subfamily)
MTGPRRDASLDRLGALYDRFAAPLFRYAAMILADRAAAADAVQQVFLKVAASRAEPDEWYLRRAVRNECFSLLRARKREIVVAVDPQLLEAAGGSVDRSAERLAVTQALGELPPEQREVVHLKAFQGMTFKEIADLTGESINTVASRYRYATEKLRALLTARS